MKKAFVAVSVVLISITYSCSSSKNIGTTMMPDPKVETPKTTDKADSKGSSKKSSKSGVVVKENVTINTDASAQNSQVGVQPQPQPKATNTKASKQQAIAVKEERVTVIQEEGKPIEAGKYYVIMGSFKVLENAQKFKTHLIIDHYNPIMLQNEDGLYRVAVGTFSQEQPARDRIGAIRLESDKYNDVWLLISKQ